MKTSERLVLTELVKVETSGEANKQRVLRAYDCFSLEELATGAALRIFLLNERLKSVHFQSEAKVLLGAVRPLDFDIGCTCPSCCARRKEWQRAKEGGL